MWEYPRQALDGGQMDFVEVMELKDGLIHRHSGLLGMVRRRSHHARRISSLNKVSGPQTSRPLRRID
jgi:hypothetical protein